MTSNMKENTFQPEQKKSALWTGISLMIMAVAAGLAYGAIHGQLYFPGENAATEAAVQSNGNLLIIELGLWLVIVLTDIVVSVKLHVFFRSTVYRLSLVAAILRLIYSSILAAAVFFLVRSLNPAEAYENFGRFEYIWSLGLIIFGVHLALLALLAFKSGFVPPFLSVLLIVAGPAYSVIHLLNMGGMKFQSMAALLEKIFSAPMALAEILLALWLIRIAFSGRKASS